MVWSAHNIMVRFNVTVWEDWIFLILCSVELMLFVILSVLEHGMEYVTGILFDP